MCQTQAVYDSERLCSWWDKYALPSEDAAYSYIRHMVKSRIWRKKYQIEPLFKLSYTENLIYDGCFWPWGEYPAGFRAYNTIELAKHGKRLSVLLHEFAHLVCHECRPTDHQHMHGAGFARCYLHLVGDFMGKQQARELLHAYNAKGVQR